MRFTLQLRRGHAWDYLPAGARPLFQGGGRLVPAREGLSAWGHPAPWPALTCENITLEEGKYWNLKLICTLPLGALPGRGDGAGGNRVPGKSAGTWNGAAVNATTTWRWVRTRRSLGTSSSYPAIEVSHPAGPSSGAVRHRAGGHPRLFSGRGDHPQPGRAGAYWPTPVEPLP